MNAGENAGLTYSLTFNFGLHFPRTHIPGLFKPCICIHTSQSVVCSGYNPEQSLSASVLPVLTLFGLLELHLPLTAIVYLG